MQKGQYRNIEDFLKDETFINWIQDPNSESAISWESWLIENPEKADLVEKAALVVRGVKLNPEYLSDTLVKTELDRLNHYLDTREEKKKQLALRKIGSWVKVAASVAFLILATGGAYHWYWNVELVYTTDFGEKMHMELDDGTKVVVNANSSLRYIRKEPRKVWMEGEVYFNVDKRYETKETFEVITPDLGIEVLGTKFNVNSRHEKTEVVLQEGSVKLNTEESGSLLMEPGEQVTFSSRDKIIAKREAVKTENHTSWKDGMLLFDSKPLKIVLSKLADIYGVEIIYGDAAIADKILNGGVPSDSLDLCIRTLRKMYGLEIDLVDKKLIIK
ncbi:FecR family protein [Membranihabitans maritimus]|uniref:FecR family protein n=1 Tax=Membranihabitans maritimus TaxID=2904244 RepID=UPI001F32FF18|nr:FecR domain-containing protein [Membranihabitans maritimus]